MDDQHERSMFCNEICCSDFLQFQDTASPSTDLTYPIHKLFHPDKFEVQEELGEHYRHMTENEYAKLEVALRLASRMLHDDVALHYFATMHDGTLHTSQGGEAKTWDQIDQEETEQNIVHTIIRQPPRTIDANRAKDILDNLSTIVECILFTPLTNGLRGFTTWELDRFPLKFSQSAKDKFPRAPKPIMLNIELELALHPDFKMQYILARTLVHEVAHAIEFAASGRVDPQTFYQDSQTDESGFELDAALFGGSYVFHTLQALHKAGLDEYVLLRDHWLSSRTCAWYDDASGARPTTLRKDGVNPPQLDKYFIMSRVPLGLLEDMCHDSFWEARKKQGSLNLSPIVPYNVYRWVFQLTTTDFEPCKPSDKDLPDRMKREFEEITRERNLRNDSRFKAFSMPPAYNREVDRMHRTQRETLNMAGRAVAVQQARAAQRAGVTQNTTTFPSGHVYQGGVPPHLRSWW